jgi:hypothetical protein
MHRSLAALVNGPNRAPLYVALAGKDKTLRVRTLSRS